MVTQSVESAVATGPRQVWFDRARATWTTGMLLGAVVGGLVGRLAMLALRLTSPEYVRGAESDDGFVIGQVTLKGTYDLIALSAVIGLIGVGAYRVVSPFLIGPAWFRSVSTALGAGAVVGAMLVHPDGIDFTLLQPTWLAIALFVAIPALFGAAVGPAVASADDPQSWINQGRRRWGAPVAVILLSPFALVMAPIIAGATFGWSRLRSSTMAEALRGSSGLRFLVRAVFAAVAIWGLLVLIGDVTAIVDGT